jgi:hypothetical protein
MPVSPKFDSLPESVKELFVQCFLTGHSQPWKRPSPREWRECLLAVEKALRRCKKNSNHRFSDHLKECPWCERTVTMRGVDPFPLHTSPLHLAPPPFSAPPVRSFAPSSFVLLRSRLSEVLSYSLTHCFIGVFVTFLWRPLFVGGFEGIGTSANTANALALLLFISLCVVIACYRVVHSGPVVRRLVTPSPATIPTPRPFVPRPQPAPRSTFRWQAAGTQTPQQAGAPVVGSRSRLIYHSPTCEWARKISARNRVQFQSAAAAQSVGYRRCQVCSP